MILHIQRMKFKKAQDFNKKGIDQILSLDYMGAAEYEFGALPESLKRIRARLKEYEYFDHPVSTSKILTVFTKKSILEKTETMAIITSLVSGEARTKGYSGVYDWANPSEFNSYTPEAWWDIDNDFFFWTKNDLFTEKFKELIK